MDSIIYGYKKYWQRRMPLAFLSMTCAMIALACDLLIPLLSADILNFYFANGIVEEGDLFAFLFVGQSTDKLQIFGKVALMFAGIILIRILFIYVKNVTIQINGVKLENDLRKDSYRKLLELDSQTLSHLNSGELLSLIDVDNIYAKDLYSRDFLALLESAVSIIVSSIFLSMINPLLMVMPVLFVPFFIVTLVRYTRLLRRLHNQRRDYYSNLCLTVNENIQAVRIVRSFANEDYENKRFTKANGLINEARIEIGKTAAKYNALFELYRQIAYAVTIAISAVLVIQGHILLGSLAAATSYVLKIMGQISAISQTVGTLQNHMVGLDRIKRFLTTETAIEDYPISVNISRKPHVKLDDVSLTIEGTQVLKHINLDIPYGKKVGIMGGTGSGKSVLLKSLTRIYEATGGVITVDGIDIRKIPLETLRNQYAYVFQDVFLFSHTIDANIAYYDDSAESYEVKQAAQIAEADPFIMKMHDGYDTVIGERGVGISGGQKQRISIARALMKHAPILVLDDASSALDMTTERKVMTGIKVNCPDISMLIAAHRVSSVEDCDEIIYMQDGEIIERGTLEQLLALNGKFAQIYHMQHSDGQLDDSSYGASEYEKEGGQVQ